jgi:hypothetical protein
MKLRRASSIQSHGPTTQLVADQHYADKETWETAISDVPVKAEGFCISVHYRYSSLSFRKARFRWERTVQYCALTSINGAKASGAITQPGLARIPDEELGAMCREAAVS